MHDDDQGQPKAAPATEILTYGEAASYLRYSRSKLERLVQRRRIPSVLVDGRRTFRKSSLEQWLTEKERASMARSRKLEAIA